MTFQKGHKVFGGQNTRFIKGHKTPWSFQKGHPSYLTEESKQKISQSLKGRKFSEESKQKMSIARKGKKLSDETKRKIGKIHKGNTYVKGKHWKLSEKTKLKISEAKKGEKNHSWKGGITPINAKIRSSIEFRLWREAVFARDNWTDQKTGVKGGKLHSHHIQNFSQYPELQFAIDNGITLSEKAHMKFHNKYGRKNNTREQLEEFIK